MRKTEFYLNMSNFEKKETKKGGHMWRFTTTLVEAGPDPDSPPRARISIAGCMYPSSRKIHTPGGGSYQHGFFNIVEMDPAWLEVLQDQLLTDLVIQEYLDTEPNLLVPPSKAAEKVAGIMFNMKVPKVGK